MCIRDRLTAYRMNGDVQRKEGTTIEFEAAAPVNLLVGYFRDDQKKLSLIHICPDRVWYPECRDPVS